MQTTPPNEFIHEIHAVREVIHQAHHHSLEELVDYFKQKEVSARAQGAQFVSFPGKPAQKSKTAA